MSSHEKECFGGSSVSVCQAIIWNNWSRERRTIVINATYPEGSQAKVRLTPQSPAEGELACILMRGKCKSEATKSGTRKKSSLLDVYQILPGSSSLPIWYHAELVRSIEIPSSSSSSTARTPSAASSSTSSPSSSSSASATPRGSFAVPDPPRPSSSSSSSSLACCCCLDNTKQTISHNLLHTSVQSLFAAAQIGSAISRLSNPEDDSDVSAVLVLHVHDLFPICYQRVLQSLPRLRQQGRESIQAFLVFLGEQLKICYESQAVDHLMKVIQFSMEWETLALHWHLRHAPVHPGTSASVSSSSSSATAEDGKQQQQIQQNNQKEIVRNLINNRILLLLDSVKNILSPKFLEGAKELCSCWERLWDADIVLDITHRLTAASFLVVAGGGGGGGAPPPSSSGGGGGATPSS